MGEFIMQLNITGRHINVGESFQDHIREHFSALVKKYFDRAVEGSVTISKDGYQTAADISVHVGKSLVIQARGEAVDPYQAFESTLNTLNQRMKKYKARLRDHHKSTKEEELLQGFQYVIPSSEEEPFVEGEDLPVVIAEVAAEIPTLTVREAVMYLDLTDHPAVLFKNKGSQHLNMIYRRSDGNIGWIDPDAPSPKPLQVKA